MNPQPPEAIGQILATLAMAWFLITFWAGWSFGPSKKIKRDRTLFKLGEIYDESSMYDESAMVEDICQPVVQTSRPQTVKVKKPKPQTHASNPLYVDCVDTLHSLGYNKNECKKTVENIFNLLT